MNVLIFGGTGAMGTYLCQLLLEGGWEVYVSSRKEQQGMKNLTYCRGDAHNLDFLFQLLKMKDWDVIVDFMNYKTEEFKNRVDIILKSTKQYIFLSSSRVYADSELPLTELSPRLLEICTDKNYLETDDYALAKARQEDFLLNNRSTNWTIIRPYITYSDYRLQLTSAEKEDWLYSALHNKPIILSKDLLGRYTTLTYGYDVARSIVALMKQKGALAEIFHITSNTSYKWEDILNNYLRVIETINGKRPQVILMDSWNTLIGGDSFQVKWDRMYNRFFDNKKINKFIGTNTFSDTLPTMAECLKRFIEDQQYNIINWKNIAQQDRLSGRWTNLIDIQGNKQKVKYLLVRCGLYKG